MPLPIQESIETTWAPATHAISSIAVGGVLALLFWRMHRAHGDRHLRLWALAWLCFALQNLTGRLLTLPWDGAAPTQTALSLLALSAQVAHYLQAMFMLMGAAELLRGRELKLRTALYVAAGITLATLFSTMATVFAGDPVREFVRHDMRYAIVGFALLPAAWCVVRHKSEAGNIGRWTVAIGFAGVGLESLLEFAVTRSLGRESLIDYLMFAVGPHVILHSLLGMGLLIWALEEKQAVARQSDQDLNERNRQLQDAHKMEAIGRLAGGVAHDFNNVLTVIFAINDQLMHMTGLPDRARPVLQELRQAARQATKMTSQLLLISRNRSGDPKVHDLNRVVKNMTVMLRRLAGERVVLMTDMPPVSCPVRLQPGHAEQVLLNLVVNARDAIPERGTVRITVSSDRTRNPNRMVITVADDGAGMSKDVKERAMEPFFTTKGDRGTGFGLAVVYGITQQSGGEVAIESAPGEGTRISVSWPEASGAIDETELSRVITPPIDHPITVLLAEDEPAVLELTSRTLQHAGYEVLAATSVEDAIQHAEQHDGRIDVLLTDVLMPGMSGPELADAIRKVRPELKVLFVSGYVDAHSKARMGSDVPLLGKPFTRRQLLSYLQSNLAKTS